MVAVYDVLVGRGGGIGETRHLLTSISDSLQREGKYYTDEISKFVETLSLLEEDDQIQICSEIPDSFYAVIGQSPVRDSLDTFLAIYEKRVERQSYSWSYAETIADNMLQIFSTPDVPNSSKTKALVLAIKGAIYMNRFAAMGTCIAMITGIEDGDLALRVAAVILSFPNSFVARVEPSACHSEPVRNAIRSIQKK